MDANQECSKLDETSSLASPTTEKETTCLISMLKSERKAFGWVRALSEQGPLGPYIYMNGASFNQSSFATGFPRNISGFTCVYLSVYYGFVNFKCDANLPYICQSRFKQ